MKLIVSQGKLQLEISPLEVDRPVYFPAGLFDGKIYVKLQQESEGIEKIICLDFSKTLEVRLSD